MYNFIHQNCAVIKNEHFIVVNNERKYYSFPMGTQVDKKSPFFGKTITIEFYVDYERILHVIYNLKNYSFIRFWNEVQDADELCRIIYEQFEHEYPFQFKKQKKGSKDWKETFIRFINSYLMEYDKIMDVVIKSSGDVQVKLEREIAL
jgi:hypothetical protein